MMGCPQHQARIHSLCSPSPFPLTLAGFKEANSASVGKGARTHRRGPGRGSHANSVASSILASFGQQAWARRLPFPPKPGNPGSKQQFWTRESIPASRESHLSVSGRSQTAPSAPTTVATPATTAFDPRAPSTRASQSLAFGQSLGGFGSGKGIQFQASARTHGT